jgi:F-type H+-transporting ATPase subunit gamma
VSGKRGIGFFKYQGITPARTYTHFEDKPSFAEVDELATRYLALFQAGEIDRLDVVSTRFVSTSRQVAEVSTLLPMQALTTGNAANSSSKQTTEYEFIPSVQDILNELVPTSFKIRLFKHFLDAAVSEQVARMIAMKGATENAGQLLKSLTRTYNRARQAMITSQICEIIGTVEALK